MWTYLLRQFPNTFTFVNHCWATCLILYFQHKCEASSSNFVMCKFHFVFYSSNIQVETMVSRRGKTLVVIGGHKFRYFRRSPNGCQSWRCTAKTCHGSALTNSLGELIGGSLEHNHEAVGDTELTWDKLKNIVKERFLAGESLEEALQNLPYQLNKHEVQRLKKYSTRWT